MTTENTKPAAPATAPDAYDAMAAAFDELVEPVPSTPEAGDQPSEVDAAADAAKAGTPPADADKDPAEGETAPAEGETKPAEGETAPAEGETKPAEGETPPAEGAPPPKAADADATDWKARFEELDARVKAQAAQPAPAQPAPPVEKPPEDTRPTYTPDEQEFLAKYDTDWPDIARGEALKRRAEYTQLVDYVFREIARVYGPMVEQGARAAETVAETTTLAAIQRVHDDYDDAMYEEVIRWSDGLVGTRKRIVQAVIEDGSPQEVVDLITEFKSATGRNKPKVVAAGGAPTPPATKVVTELSATAKQAARALGVVDSKRSAVSAQGADPSDFDAAWDEAVGK